MTTVGFEGEGGDEHQRATADILPHGRRDEVAAGGKALLPDGAGAHAEHRNQRGCQCRRGHAAAERAELRPQHDDDADKADAKAKPMARQDRLAEKLAGKHRRDQRLQADDEGRKAGRHAPVDGPEHSAEIDAMHQDARAGGMQRLLAGGFFEPNTSIRTASRMAAMTNRAARKVNGSAHGMA